MQPTNLLFFLAVFFSLVPSATFAAFYPGETLNPSCLPTDPTCIVLASTSPVAFTATTFTSTSTTATSTLPNLDVTNLNISGTVTGVLSSVNASTTNATSTNATSSFLYVGGFLNALLAYIDQLTVRVATLYTASVGSLTATSSASLASTTLSGATLLSNATATNLYITGSLTTGSPASFSATSTFSTTTAASSSITAANITNLYAATAVIGNSTTTNSTSTNSYTSGTISGGNLSVANATATSLNITNGITAASSTISGTTTTGGLYANFITALSAFFTTLGATNLTATNATSTNLYVSGSSTLAAANISALTGGAATHTALYVAGSSTLGTTNISQINGGTATFSSSTVSGTITAGALAAGSSTISGTSTTAGLFASFANIFAALFDTITARVATLYTATVGSLTATSTANLYGGTQTSNLIATGTTNLSTTYASTIHASTTYATTSNASTTNTMALNVANGAVTASSTGLTANNFNATTLNATLSTSSYLGVTANAQLQQLQVLGTATTTFNGPLATQSGNFTIAGATENDSVLLVPYGGSVGIGGSALGKFGIQQGTLTSSENALNINGTWNNAGTTFTGMLVNFTDTASAAGSYIANYQINGSPVFRISKTGTTTLAGGLIAGSTSTFSGIDMNSTRIGNLLTPSSGNDAATKSYVDALIQGLSWQAPVNSLATTTIAASTTGDRYIIYIAGGINFTGCAVGDIAENTGIGAWTCTTAATGTTVFVDSFINESYTYNGSAWNSLGSAISHNSLTGLQGGTANEYYHVNATDYASLTGVGAQLAQLKDTGSPTFVGLSTSGTINAADGSAASSSYTFANDNDTGMYRAAANTIGFATNGISRMTIDGNGNVIMSNSSSSVSTTSSLTVNTSLSIANGAVTASSTGLTANTINTTNINVAGGATLASTTVSGTTTTGGLFASFANIISAVIASLTSYTGTFGTLTATTSSSLASTTLQGAAIAGAFTATSSASLASTTLSGNTLFTSATGTNLSVNNLNLTGSFSAALTNGFVYRGSSSNVSEATSSLFITDSGNVGIGTTSPRTDSGRSVHIFNDLNAGTAASNAIFTVESLNRNAHINTIIPSNGVSNWITYAADKITAYGGMQVNANSGSPFIGFSTNNAERLRIDSSGNVGIGTISPNALFSLGGTASNTKLALFDDGASLLGLGVQANQFRLHLDGSGNRFSFLDTPAGANELMTILGTGNIGIGQTTPLYKLDVAGAGRFTGDGSVSLHIGSGQAIRDTGGMFVDTGTGGTGDLFFRMGSGFTNTLVLTNGGNVGIGTTTPDNKLVIVDVNSASLKLSTTNDPANYYTKLTTQYDSAEPFYITSGAGGAAKIFGEKAFDGATRVTYLSGFYGLGFATGDVNPSLSDVRMVINQTGNVGIGTISPNALFSLGGTASNTKLALFDDGASLLGLGVQANQFRLHLDGSGNRFSFLDTPAGANELMTILGTGNVGIGTTTPSSLLSVSGSSGLLLTNTGTSYTAYFEDTTNDASPFVIDASGNVGIGTSTPAYKLDVNGSARFGETGGDVVIGDVGSAADLVFEENSIIKGQGAGRTITIGANSDIINFAVNVGVGNTGPSVALDVTGDIEYTGTITDVSDERLKENITPISTTTAMTGILALNPVAFNMIGQSAAGTQLGFVAQNVQQYFPDAVSVIDAEGHLGLDYTQLIAPIVAAIKELAAKISETANLIVATITAHKITADELCARDAAGASTCVTKAQLDALLAGPSGASSSHPPSAPNSSATFVLNGNNPTEWQLNAHWHDNLGALLTRNGSTETIYSTSTIDTSVSGTTTIEYWAQVPLTGAWLTTTREVIVATPANDNPANDAADPDETASSTAQQ